jgi:hypothetical protein
VPLQSVNFRWPPFSIINRRDPILLNMAEQNSSPL